MIKPIYVYGSEVLRQEAAEVDLNEKEEILSLIQDLKDTLKVADGCGLAAPQIGVSKKVVIVDGTDMADYYPYLKDFRKTLINPVIIEESKSKRSYQEGCLSVPGIYADVTRSESITVQYYNEEFEKVEEHLDKFACRIVQHEMSHLDGHLFVDFVAPVRKKMLAKKLKKISAGKVSTRYNSKIK